MLRLQVFAVVFGAALTAASASDWPQFRGPGGQGIAEVSDVPVTWSDSKNIAWKSPVAGLGWSSPAIVGDRIFLTTAVPEGDEAQSLRAVCFSAKTGKQIWTRECFQQTGHAEIHSKNSHASSTPLVADNRVYVHFGPHGTAALDLGGKILWKNEELKYGPTHGNGGSPALAGDRLILCCDGHDEQFIAALNSRTGKILWRTDRRLNPKKGFSFGTPLVIDVAGRQQVICPGSNAVQALNPVNGEEIWRVTYDGYSVVPRPIFANGLVILSTGYDDPSLLAIDPTGTGDVTASHLRWTIDRAAPNNPSPVAVGDDLYFISDNGILSCVDVATGEKHWQQRLGGAFSASLLYADGRLYALDENGRCVVFEPGPEFKQVAENTLGNGERTYASFAAINGALFLRSESSLYRIGSPADVAAAK